MNTVKVSPRIARNGGSRPQSAQSKNGHSVRKAGGEIQDTKPETVSDLPPSPAPILFPLNGFDLVRRLQEWEARGAEQAKAQCKDWETNPALREDYEAMRENLLKGPNNVHWPWGLPSGDALSDAQLLDFISLVIDDLSEELCGLLDDDPDSFSPRHAFKAAQVVAQRARFFGLSDAPTAEQEQDGVKRPALFMPFAVGYRSCMRFTDSDLLFDISSALWDLRLEIALYLLPSLGGRRLQSLVQAMSFAAHVERRAGGSNQSGEPSAFDDLLDALANPQSRG